MRKEEQYEMGGVELHDKLACDSSAAPCRHRDDGRSRRTTRGEYLGRRLCLVELSMVQRRPALQVRRVDIGSCVDQNWMIAA